MFPPSSRYALEAINPDGFLALRPEGGVEGAPEDFLCEYANPASEALLEENLNGRRLLVRRPELVEAVKAWGQVLATGVTGTHLFSLGRGLDARRMMARAARVEDGLLAVWLSDVTDTERFVSETAAFEEKVLSFMECMPDPFLAFDRQCRFIYVNRAAERLLGKRRQLLVGRSLWQEYPEEPGSVLRPQVQRALATGAPVDFEERFNGLHLEVTAVPSDSGVLVYLHDATSHHRASDAARRASALFNAVLQGATDAIYTKDLQGRYTRINTAGARLIGKPAEAIIGRTDAELWSPEAARATLSHDREVLAFRQTFTYEESESGPVKRVWLSTKGVLRDEAGVVFGLFGISRDITDLKLLEEALRQNEARVLEALSAASLTLWDLRLPERRLRWERGAAAAFALRSLAPEEPLDSFLSRVHPDDQPVVTEALARCARSPGEVSLTYRVLAPDGSERRHALRARACADGQGQTRVLGVLEDLSGRTPAVSVAVASCADMAPAALGPRRPRNVPRAATGEVALHGQRTSLVLQEEGHEGERGERNEVGLIGSAAQGDG
ncbi:PAS domain-containing protein [Archangium violaceum]|uniref:PAS domain-containing protein n=1 Tax=Archangium violaceum TaxID=83451 RepID=UPI00194DFEB7|nr:PAS domain-containing protein [Archangium violaceum]QRN96010.1 PAS domain-containing protein [Archangium violaceum]